MALTVCAGKSREQPLCNDAATRPAEHLGQEHRGVLASGFCSESEYLRLYDWVYIVKEGEKLG